MQTDIAIIGGGISGLYMASALQAAGADYCLTEARARFGGRILSAGNGQSQQGYDLGPSWFWPGQPRMAALIRSAGLTAYPQYSQGELVYEELPGQIRQLNFSTMEGALRVQKGMGALVRFLQAPLDADRLLSQTGLQSARYVQHAEGDHWQLILNGPDGERSLQAKALVLALPPRVIASTVHFEPALSAVAMQGLTDIPTWMGRFTKVIVEYETPFWRDKNLSGDVISRSGPLQEIHDASLPGVTAGALFGFIQQLPRETDRQVLEKQVTEQLVRLFGEQAAMPLNIWTQDWSAQQYSATDQDWEENLNGHPQYGLPDSLGELSDKGLLFTSTEMARCSGGLLEGALEAADAGLNHLRILGLLD